MKNAVIYKLTAPNGKAYIGQTTNFNKRINTYRRLECAKQPKIYASLSKYGFDAFTVDIIHEVEKVGDYMQLLNDLEISYIKYYNSVEEGLNVHHGGKNKIHDEDSRANMSKAQKANPVWLGKKHTEETKAKMSFARMNLSPESSKNVSDGQRGRKHPEEVRKKMSDSKKGKPQTDKQKKSKIGTNWEVKKVGMYSLDGTFIREFISTGEAARQTGIKRGNISQCICGARKTTGGHIFKNI